MTASGQRGRPWGTPELKRELARAIALHRREYGNAHYELVRERPEFAEWVGKAAGETGRKRFNRMVRRVREPLPRDRTRPLQNRGVNEEQYAWAQDASERANEQSSLPIRLSPEQVMAGGGTALVGFAALQDLIQQGPADIQRIRAAALIDDPEAPGGKRALDPELLLKSVLGAAKFAQTIADLQRAYSSIFLTQELGAGAIRIALDAAGPDAEVRRRVVEQFAELIQQLNGLRPGSIPA